MRIAIFCHSLLSDWNHGNAHFLRGIASELLARSHDVHVYEPANAWSVQNLVADAGESALDGYRSAYPQLASVRYDPQSFDLDRALDGVDLVLVHEWNDHDLVRRIGEQRARGGRFVLLFHDTHHRSVSEPDAMAAYDLSHYDGVLAFGEVIRQRVGPLRDRARSETDDIIAGRHETFHDRRQLLGCVKRQDQRVGAPRLDVA